MPFMLAFCPEPAMMKGVGADVQCDRIPSGAEMLPAGEIGSGRRHKAFLVSAGASRWVGLFPVASAGHCGFDIDRQEGDR